MTAAPAKGRDDVVVTAELFINTETPDSSVDLELD